MTLQDSDNDMIIPASCKYLYINTFISSLEICIDILSAVLGFDDPLGFALLSPASFPELVLELVLGLAFALGVLSPPTGVAGTGVGVGDFRMPLPFDIIYLPPDDVQ